MATIGTENTRYIAVAGKQVPHDSAGGLNFTVGNQAMSSNQTVLDQSSGDDTHSIPTSGVTHFSPPSGYAADGSPTFGDGFSHVMVTNPDNKEFITIYQGSAASGYTV